MERSKDSDIVFITVIYRVCAKKKGLGSTSAYPHTATLGLHCLREGSLIISTVSLAAL